MTTILENIKFFFYFEKFETPPIFRETRLCSTVFRLCRSGQGIRGRVYDFDFQTLTAVFNLGNVSENMFNNS